MTRYRAMIAAATKVPLDHGDLEACAGKWRPAVSALAETINRLEAQIMRVVEDRLVTHWGADINTMIYMHDGVMVIFVADGMFEVMNDLHATMMSKHQLKKKPKEK